MIIKDGHINSKKGFMTVFALLIMSIIMIFSTYLIYITKFQSLITVSSINKVQSYYLAESKINKVLYDDKYYLNHIYPVIKNKLQDMTIPSYRIDLDSFDLDENDKYTTVTIGFTNYSTAYKRNIFIESKSIYNGIETSLKAYGPLVNDLYEQGIPVLDNNTCQEIDDLINYISNNISIDELPSGPDFKVLRTFDNDKIIITNDKKIELYRNNIKIKEDFMKKKNIFIIENKLNRSINLQIGDKNNDAKIEFEGLLYIDGDLYINSNIDFKGIVIVNGNTYLNPDIIKESKIEGIVLTNGTIEDGPSIFYKRSYIYRYGVYIPGFIHPRLELYKEL
ncbi:hypothetical protein [Paratissierella segnis]|uniref:Uncharacterized protein n=1 Tax=Paratissierella segnis TaxID=2763679 RepID=A0A926IFF7_9FIRM|nr:hypothetical protein [Paratissierella segnis]MBC8588447.1 hypothetical protein [Paratissierella segnis]